MTHVYLNETEIKSALKARVITEREAKELTRMLKRCNPTKEAKPRTRLVS